MADMNDFIPDREIVFDYPIQQLELVKGEFIAKDFKQVEDRKGNPGIFGDLKVTNLRVIWIQNRMPRVNLSIGYNVFVKMALVQQDVGQDAEHVQIKAFHNESRYEFFFYRKKNVQGTFDILPRMYNSYDGTRGYREVLIRKILTHGGTLTLWEREKIIAQFGNAWNLGKQEGKLGRLIMTNVRLVWVSMTNENFNISIPWIRMLKVFKKNSNFGGEALCVQVSKAFGGLEIGFKVDSIDCLALLEQTKNLMDTYKSSPFLGTPESISSDTAADTKSISKTYFEESQFVDTGYNEVQNIKAIYRDDSGADSREVDFNSTLGLAFERLPKDVQNLEQLWKIMRF